MLRQQFNSAGYEIDPDALALIAARSDFSALIARSEVAKIMTYAGTTRKITVDDVDACMADQQSAGFQEVIDAALEGNGREALMAFRAPDGERTKRYAGARYTLVHAATLAGASGSVRWRRFDPAGDQGPTAPCLLQTGEYAWPLKCAPGLLLR